MKVFREDTSNELARLQEACVAALFQSDALVKKAGKEPTGVGYTLVFRSTGGRTSVCASAI
jgi:hypothetical protein